jgi:hypothetical protein
VDGRRHVRVWVTPDHDIVRFLGKFVDPAQEGSYAGFDSLRYKAASGHLVPWRLYLDQTGKPPYAPGSRAFRTRVTMWGFDTSGPDLQGKVDYRFEGVNPSHSSEMRLASEDVYLESERRYVDWLVGKGLMAPIGQFESKVCQPIIEDTLKANRVLPDRTLTCRILLTRPVETVLFESIIGVSISAFDLAPNTAAVAILIAREVALAQVRSQHMDLVWGRPDTLLRDEMRY